MIRSFRGLTPTVAQSAYLDPSAQVIGDVTIGDRVSVWCNVTIRGDVHPITIGDDSNIQDNSCLHVDTDRALAIGERVVVGHSATVHACTVEDDCLIGMGATVLSGARIGAGSIVAAGSLVLEGQQVPPRSLVAGVPAKIKRDVSEDEVERTRRNAASYVSLSREYRKQDEHSEPGESGKR